MSATGRWIEDLQEAEERDLEQFKEEYKFLKQQLKHTEAALVRAEKNLKHMEYLEKVVLSGDGFTCCECGYVFDDKERDGNWWHCFEMDICEPCAKKKFFDLSLSQQNRLKDYLGD